MNRITYYFDLNAAFLFSILVHIIVLSLPLYYLPQTVRYVPIVNLTPVELLVIEPAKTNLQLSKGKVVDMMQAMSAPKNNAPPVFKRDIEKKDFSRLNVLDSKSSKIMVSKGTSFFPEDKKVSYSSGDFLLKGLAKLSETKGEPEDSFDFGGTVGERWVRSKPQEKPSPEVDKEVTIMLKFWVTPSGQVFDVSPEKKGDAFLEKTAIDYLRKWTFDPLPSDVVQENQWGILPVRFKKR